MLNFRPGRTVVVQKIKPSRETFDINGQDVTGIYLTVKYGGSDRYYPVFLDVRGNAFYRWESDAHPARWVQRPIGELSPKRRGKLMEVWFKSLPEMPKKKQKEAIA